MKIRIQVSCMEKNRPGSNVERKKKWVLKELLEVQVNTTQRCTSV